MPKHIKEILDTLNANGYSAYLVGGCVRDFLMGKIPMDYDIATSALPEDTRRCFRKYPVIETGIKHGTVTVVTEFGNVEITTYRVDGEYSDKRHPETVTFSGNIAEDLKRRDFTINAMAYNEKDGLIDLFSGKQHIKEKTICCVGDAHKRFNEDALRILRALRFASVLGFKIEKNTKESIIKNKVLLKNISVERIFVELKKLLCGENATEILMEFRCVFEEFIENLSSVENEKYSFIVKSLKRLGNDINLRLSLFLSMFHKENAGLALKKLKADNKTILFVKTVIDGLKYNFENTKISVKSFLKIYSPEIFDAVISLKTVMENKNFCELIEIKNSVVENNECYSVKQLKITGKDLTDNFGISGAEIKETLEFLVDCVICNKVKNEKNSLISYLKEKIW